MSMMKVPLTCYSCNTNSRTPKPLKILIVGSDRYVNTVLRPYVEQFSAKPSDWQGYIKFLVIPVGEYLTQLLVYCLISDKSYFFTTGVKV